MNNRSGSRENRGIKHLFRFNLTVTIATAVVVGILVWYGFSVFLYKQNISEMRSLIGMASELGLKDIAEGGDFKAGASAMLDRINNNGNYDIAIALEDGTLLGDIDRVEKRGVFNQRHEIMAAVRDGEGISRRYSDDHGKSMLYLAKRFPIEDGKEHAIIRISIPIANLQSLSRSDVIIIFLFALCLVAFSLMISHAVSKRATGPVEALERTIDALGQGTKVKRLVLPETSHLATLATALNEAADKLDERMKSMEETKAFSDTVLLNIPSGVITLDDELNVTMYNEAAAYMMGFTSPIPTPNLKTARIQDLELIKIVYDTMKTKSPVRGEFKQGATGKKVMDVFSTTMSDSSGNTSGVLLLISDLTTVRRLETIRQDFVGNVAHELRTPVTSISGFAELLGRTTHDEHGKITRYSAIILRQAKHMETIINDLLLLASLDDSAGTAIEQKTVVSIRQTIDNAVELCGERVGMEQVKLTVHCPDTLEATIHQGLMEQAIVNLIENAVKYGVTQSSDKIEISAAKADDGTVEINVTDYGNGIPAEQQERIFERFYRIDKGRTREYGGTGLGLSIVKHIMRLHAGTVFVVSKREVSTTFTLKFPKG